MVSAAAGLFGGSSSAFAFTQPQQYSSIGSHSCHHNHDQRQPLLPLTAVAVSATMAEAGVPAASSEADADATDDIELFPTNLPSDCGMDYIPLATLLATGQLAEADQVCRVVPAVIVAFMPPPKQKQRH